MKFWLALCVVCIAIAMAIHTVSNQPKHYYPSAETDRQIQMWLRTTPTIYVRR